MVQCQVIRCVIVVTLWVISHTLPQHWTNDKVTGMDETMLPEHVNYPHTASSRYVVNSGQSLAYFGCHLEAFDYFGWVWRRSGRVPVIAEIAS